MSERELLQFLPFLFIGGVLALIGLAVLIDRHIARRRREALRKQASRLGLDFAEDAGFLKEEEFHRTALFSRGGSKRYKNAMLGKVHGVQTAVFDYSYEEGSGKNRRRYRQSMAAFKEPGRSLPAFEMRPENLLHKLGSLFGYQDIDFEHCPGFSKAYLLRGPDEAAVRGIFNPTVLNQFEQNPGWSVEGIGPWVLCYRTGKTTDPGRMQAFLDETVSLISVFPRR